MTQQIINIGSAPNDGTGDLTRNAFDKSNQNFTELYTLVGGGGGGGFTASSTAPASPNSGDHWYDLLTGVLSIYVNDGSSSQWVMVSPAGAGAVLLRGYIDGLTLAWVSNTSFSVAAGQATNSTNVASINLAAAITKTTSAWAVGSGTGGIDTGAVAANTWYHVHLIRRSDTGVVDALFSLSATAPTMPTNYTQFRRIGSLRTNASSQFIAFTQIGDMFFWAVPVRDVNAATYGVTTALLTTMTVPTGFKCEALFFYTGPVYNTAVPYLLLTSPDQTDSVPSATLFSAFSNASITYPVYQVHMLTNTSAQIRERVSATDAQRTITTYGWIDPRGRNA